MKRWKQVYEIREDNFVQLALMDCVTDVKKYVIKDKENAIGIIGSWVSKGIYLMIGDTCGGIGDFLVQDVCDHWELYPKKFWDKIKDEEI